MHNTLARIQATFGYFTTLATTLACVVALLSVIPYPTSGSPSATVSVRDVQVVKGRPHYYSTKRDEYAQIRFDLTADLSSLFTWNTKQIFIYVTANYPGESEAVIWDRIVPTTATPYSYQNLKQKYFPEKKKKAKKEKALSKPGLVVLKNEKSKYQITDPSGKIAGIQNVTLQVSWNVQPWVGALVWDKGYLGGRTAAWKLGKGGRSKAFNFPAVKGSTTKVVKDAEGSQPPKAGSAVPVVEV